ncbi:MAG TPA: imelysin family protein [Dongiaceae bacterium]|jgi:putative iron-regulated protein|nr:imelysin family protein [Dongiaceae bacterium]
MTRPFFLAFSAALLASTSLVASLPARAAAPDPKAILTTYADIGEAGYADAVAGAEKLKTAVDSFLAAPTDANLKAARQAWIDSRVPYMQTEAFRFGNPEIDDLEGNVNSWPLDEGLIDYVDTNSYGTKSDSNPLYTLNIIANKSLKIGNQTIDASKITGELITSLQSAGDNEANVSIGYHAIEFLLWGQDLNGTGPGAGNRPASDYDTKNCTHDNCDRRADYLRAATDLLIDDLKKMEAVFAKDGPGRKRLLDNPEEGLGAMFTGLGSLSYGELAGERTKLGLILHDPEEEHDCFSDNTHNSDFYDEKGMVNVYTGTYTRTDGSVIKGPSLKDLVAAKDAADAKRVDDAIKAATDAMTVLKQRADSGKEAYDQMIGPDNPEGNKIVQNVVDTLVAQAKAWEAAVAKLNIKITVEGSDSLDNPSAVTQ